MSAELDAAKTHLAAYSRVKPQTGPDRWLVDALAALLAPLEKSEPKSPPPRPRFVPSERVDE